MLFWREGGVWGGVEKKTSNERELEEISNNKPKKNKGRSRSRE